MNSIQPPNVFYTVLFLFVFGCLGLLGLTDSSAHGDEGPVPSYTLPEILALTLQHHPMIELGQGVIDEKSGRAIMAQAYPNPILGIQSGYGRVQEPRGPSLIERYFSLSQPLEWPGTRAARQQGAEAGVRGAEASLEETQVTIAATVKIAFYGLLLAETLADLASQVAHRMEELEGAVRQRVESGESPPLETLKVQVELLQAKKQVEHTTGNVRTRKVVLDQLTAGHLGANFDVQGDFESKKELIDEQSLIEMAFQKHPEIRKFQHQIELADAQYHEERQARIPNLTVSGAYQRDAGREGIVGGISLPLPIWNQRQGDLAKALGFRRQAEANLHQAKISLRRDIAEQVQMAKTASTQIHTFEQGLLKQAKEAVRIARTSFKYGEANLLDVLDAQRVLSQAFQGYAQARFELSVAFADLERLIGKEL